MLYGSVEYITPSAHTAFSHLNLFVTYRIFAHKYFGLTKM